MARYSEILTDQYERPIAGAFVTVTSSADNSVAELTNDDGSALENPFPTSSDGAVVFNTAGDYYDLDFHYGGRLVQRDLTVPVGTGLVPPGAIVDALGAGTTIAPSQRAVSAAFTALAGSGGAATVGFKAASGSKTRSVQTRMRESVTLADYWTPGDAPANLPAACASAYTDGRFLEIPKSFDGMSAPAGMNNLVPVNKGLMIGARINGIGSNATIKVGDGTAGPSEVYFEGGHLNNVVLELAGGTPRIHNPSCSGRSNVAAILLRGASGTTWMNALIDGADIQGANYGILANGDLSVGGYNWQLINGRLQNLYGDGIELNLIPTWRNTQILNWAIDGIGIPPGSVNVNWGIAIGWASGYDVTCDSIMLSRLRQGIHCEYSYGCTISRIHGDDITSVYSPANNTSGALAVAGVQVYGGQGNTVSDLSGVMDVRIEYGASGGMYVNPPCNLTASAFDLDGGNIIIHVGSDGTAAFYTRIRDLQTYNGQVQILGRTENYTVRNVTPRKQRGTGPALVLSPDFAFDNRGAFRSRNTLTKAVLQNVTGVDDQGAPSFGQHNSINTFSSGAITGFNGLQKVEAPEINFPSPATKCAHRVTRTFYGDWGNQAVPFGLELVAGDLCININATTPSRSLITTSGSRNRAGDNFIVSAPDAGQPGANRTLKTNAGMTWTETSYHADVGQQITLTYSDATVQLTSVVAAYISSSTYWMIVADDLTGAIGLTGAITSTNAVAWQPV